MECRDRYDDSILVLFWVKGSYEKCYADARIDLCTRAMFDHVAYNFSHQGSLSSAVGRS